MNEGQITMCQSSVNLAKKEDFGESFRDLVMFQEALGVLGSFGSLRTLYELKETLGVNGNFRS